MRRGETTKRIDPKFIAYGGHQEIQAEHKNSLGALVLQEPDYGAAERAVPMLSPDDAKYIRITDYGEDGIEPNHEFVTAELVDEKYLIEDEDILFARSGATAGKTFIYSKDLGKAIFAGYCIRFRFDKEKVLPKYVYFYTKTNRYAAWVNSMQRAAGQPNINKEEYKSFVIPLPALNVQRTLVADMESARLARQAKLGHADELLKGIDGFVLDELGLKKPKEEKKNIFAVRFGEIKKRSDPDYHSPYFRKVRSAIQKSKLKVVKLGKILQKPLTSGFAAGRNDQAEDEQEGVPHVRPFNISPNGEFRLETIKYVPRENVAENDWLTKGEVLFNNTNSTEWVGKTAVFDSDEPCACSNHITRLFLNREEAEPLFIASQLNAFRSLGLFGLLSTNFNNQAGINSETLSELEILLPPLETQKKIAKEIESRRTQARAWREEAEREWQNAKEKFEKALLG